MNILRSERAARGIHLVLMFGLGMLGSSIRSRLLDAEYSPSATIAFDWPAEATWPESLQAIEAHCQSRAPRRISVVWTAGGKGFRCSQEDAHAEIESFTAVLAMVRRLRTLTSPTAFDFHFMSSAGGLYEGQCAVDEYSAPSPSRPYGQLKLRQENLLRQTFPNTQLYIYRPSTVYGPMIQKSYQGLVNNLVNDGLRGRLTVLDAHVMSLRDYVYFADIGDFVARQVMAGQTRAARHPIYFLVSSRCSSIFEVARTIERVLHLKLRYRYDEAFGNHRNITFGARVLPAGWSPTPLEVGIRQFVAGKYAPLHAPARTN